MADTNSSSSSPKSIRLETESFNLSENYVAKSSQGYIELLGSNGTQGSASVPLSVAGTYKLVVGYYDENDGESSVEVGLNGQTIDAWVLDDITQGDPEKAPYDRASPETFLKRTLAQEVTIQSGDILSIDAVRGDGERARIDYVDLIPVEEQPPTQDEPTSPPTLTANKTLRLEAEDYQAYKDTTSGNEGGAYRKDDVDIEKTSDAGGGYNVGWIAQGEWLDYTIDVQQAGDYDLTARVAAKGSEQKSFSVNGQAVDFSATGGWQDWQTIDAGTLSLSAGTNKIRVSALSERFNVNYFELVAADSSPEPEPPTPKTAVEIDGELRTWHDISLTFDGPSASETDSFNPFLNYRLDVTFTNGSSTYVVPGYFAADGEAAETSATAGNQWRVHFSPPKAGTWNYEVNFQKGNNVAIADNLNAGSSVAGLDGLTGSFKVASTNKAGRDFRGKGRLEDVGEHYLRHAGTKEYFLKGGAGSPENFLGYWEFDGTKDNGGKGNDLQNGLHRYSPHVKDWRSGDPVWQGDQGKGIIGALNYLASEEMNSVYFLSFNTEGGDGQEVYPWTTADTNTRYDVSKLEQWEIVFDHMDQSGIMLHLLTQEQENDQALDGGNLGSERKLYYRELVARFGHHLGLTWNLGEENTNTNSQRRAFADYLRDIDPYDSAIVVHTYPGQKETVYSPLLGNKDLNGASLQSKPAAVHADVLEWRERSAASGQPWIVTVDEIGPANRGALPDANSNHDDIRDSALWGGLMAGGAGIEWYFGYDYPNNDLDAEDWRSRDNLWDQTRHALNFFQEYLPFWDMESLDSITSDSDDYVFGKTGEIYAVYLPDGGSTAIDLPQGSYDVQWYNPRSGGSLVNGSIASVSGGENVLLGNAPNSQNQDWVVLVTNDSFSL
ncbi:MAG: DUF5060 domain-containing protein [Cyanophyceae cyanobacterium]